MARRNIIMPGGRFPPTRIFPFFFLSLEIIAKTPPHGLANFFALTVRLLRETSPDKESQSGLVCPSAAPTQQKTGYFAYGGTPEMNASPVAKPLTLFPPQWAGNFEWHL
jgi:hypothetical protein